MNPRPEPKTITSTAILWWSLGLCIISILSFFLALSPHDYWWYLRLGRDVLSTGAIPIVESFSYTRNGIEIIQPCWLAGVLFWLVHQAGGLALTFLVRGVLLGATYSLLWRAALEQGAGPRISTLIALFAAVAGANNWSFRPQLWAYPLFAAVVWLLLRWERGEKPPLWCLPLISILWVSLHGSFLILFVVLGIAFLFGRGDRKRLLLWSAAALVATLLNPQGLGPWRYTWMMLTTEYVRNYGLEWALPSNNHWQLSLFFASLLAIPVLTAFAARRPGLMAWGWYLALGWLALSGVRHVIWFLFLLIPLASPMLTDLLGRFIDPPAVEIRARRPVNLAMSVFFVLLSLAALPGLRNGWVRVDAVSQTPSAAVDWLRAHPDLPGPIWNDLVHSSYLIYALPERPIWIDLRLEVYPASQWEEYITIADARPGWQALLARDHVQLLFLSPIDEPGLIQALQTDSSWCEQYRDDLAIIYSRCAQ